MLENKPGKTNKKDITLSFKNVIDFIEIWYDERIKS